jgi:hypothetical protein
MTVSANAKRALFSMKHIKEQSLSVLNELKTGRISEIRETVDNYRTALSLFEEDKTTLKEAIKMDYFDPKTILEIKANLEINDIVDATIQEFVDAGVTLVADDPEKKELNFRDFDTLIDYSLPKTWNFNIDLICIHESNRKYFSEILKKRKQKRILYLGETFEKISDEIFIVNQSDIKDALHSLPFPLPKRVCFLDKMFFNKNLNYIKATKEITSKLQELTSHKNTKSRFGQLWIENSIENFKQVALSPSVKSLENIFSEENVIVISPGPSLKLNISELERPHSALTIAVAQAVPALLQHNIIPDFILVMDPQDYAFTLDNFDLSKTSLICPEYVSPSFTEKNFLRKFFLISSNSCFEQNIYRKHQSYNLDDASSVSVVAVRLSQMLGAKTIALLGQDLSFSSEQYYGSLYDPSKIEGVKQDPHILKFKLPGYNGGTVETNYQYTVYHKQFENFAAKNSNLKNLELYNCTEGGADISGFKNMPLSEYIKNVSGKANYKIEIIESLPRVDLSYSESFRFLDKLKSKNKKIIDDIQKLKKIKRGSSKNQKVLELKQKILNSALATEITKDYTFTALATFAESNSMGFKSSIMEFQSDHSIREIDELCRKLNVRLNKVIKFLRK